MMFGSPLYLGYKIELMICLNPCSLALAGLEGFLEGFAAVEVEIRRETVSRCWGGSKFGR